ncbi:MAG: 1-deoxy-D-xylulose-5-phosphate synthase [Clostridia bacterium]|nr:1-deoxy-D-xylulose-5-phosphate synthase [Clostridia bacterium]
MYKYLDAIKGPEDLKKLTVEELKVLAYEVRLFLIDTVSKTGGHLASNLGVVELTIALHYVFDSPVDHIIWDVSHQAYVHKILTGRQAGFETLRQLGGMSGFVKRAESEHDKFDTGHSSTSISAGVGVSIARDLKGENFDVVAVIGDGAMTGGMAFEAMNHLGHSNTNMKIILNDNEMSISKNVGGLSRALNKLRTTQGYYSIKGKTKVKLSKFPSVGEPLVRLISKAKGGLKYFLVNQGQFFEDLGLTYIGPVDGHDLGALIDHLIMVKKAKDPVVLHVVTQKGKGYGFSEQRPYLYHGVGKFNPQNPIVEKTKTDYSQLFGDTLVDIGEKYDHVVAISAAMIDGTGLTGFCKRFPNRTFDVGIAEQHAVTMAAGLMTQGIKPFVAIYSTFLQRAYDQVLHDVCIQNLPVVFCIDRAGIVGNDGETHHGLFDISYLNAIPNMMLLSPKDGEELEYMMRYAAEYNEGPIAIRYPRGNVEHLSSGPITNLLPEMIHAGEKIALVATGKMVGIALEAAKKFEAVFGERISVVNIRKIKPLDSKEIKALLKNHKIIITLEDHSIIGGLGDQIGSLLLNESPQRTIYKMGFADSFVEQGNVEDIFKAHSLDSGGVFEKIRAVNNA